MRRLATARLVAIPLACALAVTACSSGASQKDDLQIVQNPVAAVPATAPAVTAKPAGTVFAAPGNVTAVATTGTTLAVGLQTPPSVRLYDLGALTAPPKSVPLPGPAERITSSAGRLLASVPGSGQVAEIALPAGTVTELAVPGTPSAATAVGDQTLVSVRDRKEIAVLAGGKVARTIGGSLYSADDVLTTGDKTVVLDRLRTALFSVDVQGGKVGEGLRAGEGVANAVADSFGRVLVTDVKAGALIAFSTDPLLMRQRYPVPGGAYGIAYDAKKALAWVTLTGLNQVVGYDVRGGEPVEKYRFPTVRQPNSVAVDETTSRVVVGSAAGEGIQVITP
ncbi:hypothetical protein [Amycolatopsis minnesotensis]|uniref:Lipoprotein n=1 Tax=Amycolatopsis minnesotensis TaxID=337894 RepID=A0ABN2PYT1_9PSEU